MHLLVPKTADPKYASVPKATYELPDGTQVLAAYT